MLSRVVQHEVDHLDGVLFIDKITDWDPHRSHATGIALSRSRRTSKGTRSMKIAFFSSGTFGLPVLEELKKENHEIVLITKVDAPSGRGLKLQPSPSAVVAEVLQIPLSR